MGKEGRFKIQVKEIPDRAAQTASRTIIKSHIFQRTKCIVMVKRVADCKKDKRTDPDQGFFPLPEP
jgi:hypothetical protein